MITPLQLVAHCRTIKDLADKENFEEIVTITQNLLDETYDLYNISNGEIKCVIDTIMIYGFLRCSSGIHEQIELIHAIVDPIITKNMLLTNRFDKYSENPSQDIGVLHRLPDLALYNIKQSLISTM